jgi:hypothetical protein
MSRRSSRLWKLRRERRQRALEEIEAGGETISDEYSDSERVNQRAYLYSEAIVEEVVRAGGVTDKAKIAAAARTWSTIAVMKPDLQKKHALAKFNQYMRRSDVRENCRDAFALVGFDIVDAMEMLKKHIKGEVRKQVLTKDGRVRSIKEPPSLPALQTYLKLAMPEAAQRVQSEVLHARVNLNEMRAAEPMSAPRVVGDFVLSGTTGGVLEDEVDALAEEPAGDD